MPHNRLKASAMEVMRRSIGSPEMQIKQFMKDYRNCWKIIDCANDTSQFPTASDYSEQNLADLNVFLSLFCDWQKQLENNPKLSQGGLPPRDRYREICLSAHEILLLVFENVLTELYKLENELGKEKIVMYSNLRIDDPGY